MFKGENYVLQYVSVMLSRVSISLVFCSDRPSEWCKENWIHWRALKSAFSVDSQLQEILHRLQQVQLCYYSDFRM